MKPSSLLRPRRRSSIKCALALAIALGAALPANASAADLQSLPPQGVYEQCAPTSGVDTDCLARLDQIRATGFDAVLNYTLWYRKPDQIQAYIDHAQSIGMKVIIPLNYQGWRDGVTDLKKAYKVLAPYCGCSDNATFTTYAIGLVRSRPGTWGYYIGDENDAGSTGLVQSLGQRVKALDPARPQMYIAFANQAQSTSNLAPYASVADIVGIDYYPVGTPDSAFGLGPIAANTQALANGAGKQSAVVLQAFSWDQYAHSAAIVPRWPNADDMRQMRDIAIANSDPQMLLWYSYNDVMRSDNPAGHLADLRSAAFAPVATPDTTIVAGTDGRVGSGDATFTQQSDLGSTFQCQLDGGQWTTCGSQQTYFGIGAGQHQFSVRSLDRRGRMDPSPATRTWTVAGSTTSRPTDPGTGNVSQPKPDTPAGSTPSRGRFALKAVRIARNGTAKLRVQVPGAGKVVAVGRIIAPRRARSARLPRLRRAAARTSLPGNVSLSLKMQRRGRSAVKARHKLKIVVTFKPAGGGPPLVRSKNVRLKAPKRHR